MYPPSVPRWLAWAREIQALSQTGLTYSDNDFDAQRYQRLGEIAAEIASSQTALEKQALLENLRLQPGYATPKIDVRGAVVRDGQVLLVQERVDERWCMPGGWADVGDLPSEMVIREVREEIFSKIFSSVFLKGCLNRGHASKVLSAQVLSSPKMAIS